MRVRASFSTRSDDTCLVPFVVYPWTLSIILLVVQKIGYMKKFGLEFSLKFIYRRWMLRGENNQFIFNVFWWYIIYFRLLLYLELYQLFFWLFKILIIWRKLRLNFFSKLSSDYGYLEVQDNGCTFFTILLSTMGEFIDSSFSSCLSNLSLIFDNRALMVFSRAVRVT